MPDGKRLWRTADGGLVEDGHPAAVSLAYGADDALSPEDAAALAEQKAAKPAANKARRPAENKGR
ncbi:hypothetical protein [Actinophytocola sp. NPDC049390]|uniref:hypothetical protein n=1 Tax=Actinophytocola sp. NPDC049390 TaxID=3363894 RepID=UPI00379E84A7